MSEGVIVALIGLAGSAFGSHHMSGRLYDHMEIYSANDTPIADFYPARRDSDNVLGMYDIVRNTFYTNIGSGTFTGGPEV